MDTPRLGTAGYSSVHPSRVGSKSPGSREHRCPPVRVREVMRLSPLSGLALVVLASCSGSPGTIVEPEHGVPEPARTRESTPSESSPPGSALEVRASSIEPVVLIDDPEMLGSLDLRFGPTLFDLDVSSTLELRKSRRFRQLAARIRDNAEVPGWWLRSSSTSFQLVAVVNRLDRVDVLPEICGETRLVYRLVHLRDDGEQDVLPVGLSALFEQPRHESGCRAVAQGWRTEPASLSKSDGPLSATKLGWERLRAVESNVRTTEDAEPYNVLAIHVPAPTSRWDEPTWIGGLLEFGPWAWYKGRGWRRVAELLAAPQMRQAIFDGVVMTSTLADLGDAPLSYRDRHSWETTRSVGLGRAERKLPEDGDYSPFSTRQAFVERARSLTCSGCHSARAVDGFHVALGASAHLQDETSWRREYVRAVAEGREPNRLRLSVHGEG